MDESLNYTSPWTTPGKLNRFNRHALDYGTSTAIESLISDFRWKKLEHRRSRLHLLSCHIWEVSGFSDQLLVLFKIGTAY